MAVSQSGGSAETVRLLELDRRARILGVTNTAAQRPGATSRSDAAFPGRARILGLVQDLCLEHAGAPVVGRRCCPVRRRDSAWRSSSSGPDLVAEYLRQWRENSEVLAEKLRGIRHLFLTGRGSSLSAVGTGALIIKEAARVHAEGMSSAAFRHGPIEMLRPDMLDWRFQR